MTEPLIKITAVSKLFGGFTALDGVDLAVAAGERLEWIGPNGSGKTTLINCISGSLRNDSGSINFSGEEISSLPAYQRTRRGIARSFQIPRPFTSMTVLENLQVPLEFVAHRRSLEHITQAVMRFSQRVICLDAGRIICEGTPNAIIADRGYIIVHGEIVFEGTVAELEKNDLVKNYYLGTAA